MRAGGGGRAEPTVGVALSVVERVHVDRLGRVQDAREDQDPEGEPQHDAATRHVALAPVNEQRDDLGCVGESQVEGDVDRAVDLKSALIERDQQIRGQHDSRGCDRPGEREQPDDESDASRRARDRHRDPGRDRGAKGKSDPFLESRPVPSERPGTHSGPGSGTR